MALQLGKTVQELVHGFTGPFLALEEITWIAYHQADPWGDDRADLRSAQISQLIHNSNVKKENVKPVTDFMPYYRKPVKKDTNIDQSIRDVFAQLKEQQKE